MSESKLATFRTDSETWENFQAKAKRNGTNASSLLQRFLRDYLDGSIDSRIDDKSSNLDGIDSRIDERIEVALNSRLSDILREVDSLRSVVLNLENAIATGNNDNTSEATAPAKTPVIDSHVESDALPIIEAIEALPAPDVLPSDEADTAAPDESLELNQKQICDRFDIDYKNLSKKAGNVNMTSDAYIMHIAKEHGEIWEKVASKGSTKLWKPLKPITP